MDVFWDRVTRLAGQRVPLLRAQGAHLLITAVHVDAVLVASRVTRTAGGGNREPPVYRIPRVDLEAAAALVQPGVPFTATALRNSGGALAYPGYVAAIVRAVLDDPPPV